MIFVVTMMRFLLEKTSQLNHILFIIRLQTGSIAPIFSFFIRGSLVLYGAIAVFNELQ